MDGYLSPSFSHDKLDNPTFTDLVDVFEDLWRSYVFEPVKILFEIPNGDVAGMTVLCSYFEAIESLTSGLSSKSKSQEFFTKGFSKVFSSPIGMNEVAKEVYIYIRCGLTHEGMLRSKVHYSRAGQKTFYLTYPKRPDGTLDTAAKCESIIVNPIRMHEGTLKHFNNYVSELRSGADQVQCDNFKMFITTQLEVGGSESIIGMTEAEFLGNE